MNVDTQAGIFNRTIGDITVGRLLAITIQLGLVIAVIHLFKIEQLHGFLTLTPIIFGGFVINALAPKSVRQPLFLLISFVAMYVLLGPLQSIALVVIGLSLIGICHLPIALWMRVSLLIGAMVVLGLIRVEVFNFGWESLSTLVMPILGAIFMFRLAVYLYDLRHERKKATIWERLSYFFMLPNFNFLLFPVIDYQTFRRTYYNKKEAGDIYQKGVLWIFRGVTHLIFYRFVYYYMTVSPNEVAQFSDVVQSMVSTYLLYLRISGQFHLIIGLMCLYGFNLPETHHLYYLASSFNDYWRRINIFWKDFMMKMFYYPAFMRLKKIGMLPALAIATIWVFFGTWILHSYQWFWLRGDFPITWPDALFWGILGGLVVWNSHTRALPLGQTLFPWSPPA